MTEESDIKTKKRSKSLFPKRTLKDALRVAEAIQSNNAGEPYDRLDLAKALDNSPSSSSFRALITASGQFGLTAGSYAAEQISLTDLGRLIVAPRTPTERNQALLSALMSIHIFKTFFTKFDTKKMPEAELVKNTLSRDLKIPTNRIKACYDMILENARELGILDEISGNTYVRLSQLSTESLPPKKHEMREDEETSAFEDEEEEEEVSEASSALMETPRKNQVFIVHGKNRKPLEQLKNILDRWKVPYLAAIDEPHKGRPISKKVADLMHECTSAIVMFTADEKYTDDKGNVIYRPSDNAVYELGASSILYGDKIVILKENEVTLASDFSDLGYISFEKDKLDAKAMDLFNEFVGLGFLKVVPT